jgi:hypothetical protein
MRIARFGAARTQIREREECGPTLRSLTLPARMEHIALSLLWVWMVLAQCR